MESKKVRLLISLIVVFIVLIAFCFIKNEDTKETNRENTKVEEKINEETNVPTEEETNEEDALAAGLYNMIKITNVQTETLDYYLNDKITLSNISEELLSYLIIKNLNINSNEDYINVSYEEVEKVHLKVFNNSNLISNYYVANIGNYQYSLEFFVELNTYILTKKEATYYDYKKDSKIISNVKKDNRLIITEEFKLFLDKSGNPTNKGIIKYTFVKNSDESYYLYNIDRLNS